MSSSAEIRERRYRIGTVSSLTGLHAHTIRAWERRYAAIEPNRSDGGTRLYSDDDVARLQLIKSITDCGEPVSVVARLATAELRARVTTLARSTSANESGDESGTLRLALLDVRLHEQLRVSASDVPDLEIALSALNLDDFLARLDGACDVLVVGLQHLGADPEAALERCLRACDAKLVIVIYEFGARSRLSGLARRGAKLLQGPLTASLLHRAVFDFWVAKQASRHHALRKPNAPVRIEGGRPERLFDESQLARLRELGSSVACECPNHLSAIVANLVAFEAYCAECESKGGSDAALHADLGHGTARARARMEQLLVKLCQHDGIRL